MQLIPALSVLLLLLAPSPPLRPGIPDTGLGRHADAFLAAYETRDEGELFTYFNQHMAPEALTRRPVEDLVEMVRRMRTDFGVLALMRVTEESPQVLRVTMRADKGDIVTLVFEAEAAVPHLLSSIRAEARPPNGIQDEPEPAAPPRSPAQTAEVIGAYVDSLARAGQFSGVVRVTVHGRPLIERAWGLADRGLRIPNRIDTRFNLGSINKIFTRTAIAQLAQSGRLSLDQTIERWVPELPRDVAARITVRELIDHRSGLGDIFGAAYDSTDKSKLRTNADYLPLFRGRPLLFEPGTNMRYSNAGYVVLGLIVERVSGESYHDYVRRHVYAPAGMKSTDSYLRDQPVPNRAVGYTRQRSDTGWRSNLYMLPERGSAAGGGYSTAADLARFMDALAGGRLLDARWSAWMMSPSAAGPDSAKTPALPLRVGGLGVAGGSPGVNAALEARLDTGTCAVVLCNLDPPAAERVARALRFWLAAMHE